MAVVEGVGVVLAIPGVVQPRSQKQGLLISARLADVQQHRIGATLIQRGFHGLDSPRGRTRRQVHEAQHGRPDVNVLLIQVDLGFVKIAERASDFRFDRFVPRRRQKTTGLGAERVDHFASEATRHGFHHRYTLRASSDYNVLGLMDLAGQPRRSSSAENGLASGASAPSRTAVLSMSSPNAPERESSTPDTGF
jgi:hypothetical protein